MTGSAQSEVVQRMLLPAIMRCVFLPSKLALHHDCHTHFTAERMCVSNNSLATCRSHVDVFSASIASQKSTDTQQTTPHPHETELSKQLEAEFHSPAHGRRSAAAITHNDRDATCWSLCHGA